MSLLSRIRVVLVGTQHPGNIGSAARAMKTMGLRNLVLVAPEVFPDPRADALAVGAVDLLEQARVCASLDEALAGCTRATSPPPATPRATGPSAWRGASWLATSPCCSAASAPACTTRRWTGPRS